MATRPSHIFVSTAHRRERTWVRRGSARLLTLALTGAVVGAGLVIERLALG